LPDVAQPFGYRYGSLRNLVSAFRARWRAGQAPPFSATLFADGRSEQIPRNRSASRRSRLQPTAVNSASLPGAACGPASRVSSCSCRCWRVSTSTRW
jgi:hypothetical protein